MSDEVLKFKSVIRNEVIHVRFTAEERQYLDKIAKQYGNGKVSTCCYQIILKAMNEYKQIEVKGGNKEIKNV